MNDYIDRDPSNTPLLLLGKPDYYDSPEGQNPWEKIWGLSKYAVATTMGMSIMDCFYITQCRNAVEVLNCTAFWGVPLVSMAVTFSSMTFMATNIRGKDDKVNYAIGALSCSPILYAWRRSTSMTCWGTAFLLAIALAKKDSKEKGWQFYYEPHHEFGNYVYDYSYTKEWPKRPY